MQRYGPLDRLVDRLFETVSQSISSHLPEKGKKKREMIVGGGGGQKIVKRHLTRTYCKHSRPLLYYFLNPPLHSRLIRPTVPQQIQYSEMDGWMDGWMDDLRFFNSVSVISGRWADDNERLCAMEPRSRLTRFRLEVGSNAGPLDQ